MDMWHDEERWGEMRRVVCAAEPGRRQRYRENACLLAIATLLVAVALAGCAHEKAFKRGTKLSEQGQYERAVEELESAVALAEKNNNEKAAARYREKLEEVKENAGRFCYHEAEIRFGRADLTGTQMFIDKSIGYWPHEQRYLAFRTRVQEAIAKAERVRNEALSLADQMQWKAAVERMNEALSMHRTMPAGEGDLKRIRDRAYQCYLARARDGLDQNDLETTEAEAQTALTYRNDGREARDLLDTVKKHRQAGDLIARGRTLLEHSDNSEALSLFEQANRLHPSHPELPGLLRQARQAVCDMWIQQGRQATAAGELISALRLFQKSHNLLKGYSGVDALMAETQSQLAEAHLAAAREHQAGGTHGCAVLHATVALGYRSTSFDARRQLGQFAGQVRQDVSYTIAFAGFRATPEQHALATALDTSALTHLTQSRPANVAVVERRDLQTLTDARKLATGTMIGASQDPFQGIDAVIMGEITNSKVTTQTKETGHGESTYQDGMRAEPNPDHVAAAAAADAALEALEQARRRLAEAEARLARYDNADPADAAAQARKRQAKADAAEAKQRLVNAATDVGAAEMRLAVTPPEVLVPNMVKHKYPIQTVTLSLIHI